MYAPFDSFRYGPSEILHHVIQSFKDSDTESYLPSFKQFSFIQRVLLTVISLLLCGTDGILLVEVDRVLRPGGYFVWTSQLTSSQRFLRKKENQKEWNFVHGFAKSLCWEMLSQQVDTVVWKKTIKKNCYSAR